jgi:hypothetical protein
VDDRTSGLLDTAVREQVAAHGRVLPPWRAFPNTRPGSIGWRMGAGEWHLMVWRHWWQAAGLDEAERIAYIRADEPPREWLGWAAHTIWPNMSGKAAVSRLAEHGIGAAQ